MRYGTHLLVAMLLAAGLLTTRTHSVAAEKDATELVVDAAAQPTPALRYRLLPISTDLKRGNAAPIYLRLIHERQGLFVNGVYDRIAELAQLDLADFPLDEARELALGMSQLTEQMHFAALREDCHWEYTMEEVNPIEILLPDAQQMRIHARTLAVQFRVQLLDGEFDQAIQTLSDGFAMARHIGRTPIIVNALIANATSRTMTEGAEQLIAQPGAPNLYWALAAMQEHPVDITRALEWEATLLTQIFPELKDLNRSRTPEQWQAVVDDMEAWLQQYAQELWTMNTLADADPADRPSPERRYLSHADLTRIRRQLVERGWYPAADVARMSDPEAIVRHIFHVAELISSEELKWAYLPYWQTTATADRRGREMMQLAKELEILPFFSLLVPATMNARFSQQNLARHLAALQLIESLRDHAATHDGSWPVTLDELELPAPLDPTTGQPFQYEVGNGAATIRSPAPPGVAPSQSLHYRVKLRK